MPSERTAIAAIAAITALQIVNALVRGADGVMLAGSVAAIAALGGYVAAKGG